MLNKTNVFILLLANTLALSSFPAMAKTYAGTINGTVSDSMCQFDHAAMIKSGHGANAAACTQKCIKDGSKFVLCDPKTKIVYNLSDSAKVKKYAGKSVAITGHIDTDTKSIHVHSVKPQ
ncbi:MAG: hypothetical protein K2X77_10665 [Candidatus Obscuribacterales bacterium]|jgi:hypothetical protein|nr:hypothetical protein [Candidatus Obscuribacterales bacterium]